MYSSLTLDRFSQHVHNAKRKRRKWLAKAGRITCLSFALAAFHGKKHCKCWAPQQIHRPGRARIFSYRSLPWLQSSWRNVRTCSYLKFGESLTPNPNLSFLFQAFLWYRKSSRIGHHQETLQNLCAALHLAKLVRGEQRMRCVCSQPDCAVSTVTEKVKHDSALPATKYPYPPVPLANKQRLEDQRRSSHKNAKAPQKHTEGWFRDLKSFQWQCINDNVGVLVVLETVLDSSRCTAYEFMNPPAKQFDNKETSSQRQTKTA